MMRGRALTQGISARYPEQVMPVCRGSATFEVARVPDVPVPNSCRQLYRSLHPGNGLHGSTVRLRCEKATGDAAEP